MVMVFLMIRLWIVIVHLTIIRVFKVWISFNLLLRIKMLTICSILLQELILYSILWWLVILWPWAWVWDSKTQWLVQLQLLELCSLVWWAQWTWVLQEVHSIRIWCLQCLSQIHNGSKIRVQLQHSINKVLRMKSNSSLVDCNSKHWNRICSHISHNLVKLVMQS